jgi:hypothetical protein
VETNGNHSFTVEFFLKIKNEPSSYTAFLSRLFTGPNPDSTTNSDRHAWVLDFNHDSNISFGKIRMRFDLPGTPPPDFNRIAKGGYVYVDTTGATGIPADYTLASGDPADEGDGINDDTSWHHVALVFDEPAGELSIYTDYQWTGSVSIQGPFTHPTADLQYGGGAFIDEVRYTEGVLDETFFLRATTFSEQETWRLQYFGAAENNGEAADTADPDGDGIKNLIEYAFGLSPLADSTGLLPDPFRTGTNAVIEFATPFGITGITYGAEYTTNLISGVWQSLMDEGITNQTHSFTKEIPNDSPLYLRLFVQGQ